jgi:Na+/proline symporter/GAF domain-containing protein
MFNSLAVVGVILAYVALLFLVALWVERRATRANRLVNSAIVYALSFAVYCTTWTFYGSVGSAATSGMLFVAIYLGPTIMALFWWRALRKLVHLKNTHHISSIADFIAARYNKSQLLAALATTIALVGVAPYIALQLRAMTSTFDLLTTSVDATASGLGAAVEPLVVGLMIVFTIVFGARRLDPTARHRGIIMAVALQSVVKLVAFLAVGIFVTFFLFEGFDDIFQRASQNSLLTLMGIGQDESSAYFVWFTYLVLSMGAILLLPRQFHVAVVENSNKRHIRSAMWLLPVYLFLICLFALPIALAGLLKEMPLQAADTFVLALPLQYGQPWLALVVFMGGFSAAMSMIMISVMTLSTMITNHLILPAVEQIPRLGLLRRQLLRVRWATIALVILIGYLFERLFGGSYTLVSMGIISFAAALQFAPAILGGLFWRQGSRVGAMLGMTAGFLVWFYTLLLPSFVKSGWLSTSLLNDGPWGIEYLKPEQLFGLMGLDSLSHAVLWTMIFNVGLYVLGSLVFKKSTEEKQQAAAFVDVLTPHISLKPADRGRPDIDLVEKRTLMSNLLSRYFPETEVQAIVERCLFAMGAEDKTRLSIVEWAEVCTEVERSLAGSVGAAAAHRAVSQSDLLSSDETKELSGAYGEILADLRVSPEELQERIDYYQERELLLTLQAAELEKQVAERTAALQHRSAQLETAVLVTREAAAIRTTDQLLNTTVRLISEHFGYYHVSIFLLDENKTNVVLRAASSPGGQRMLARGYSLRIGEMGIVGYVAGLGRSRIAFKAGEDAAYFDNPDLPDTRSEIALPLRIRERVIGVLDIQSTEDAAFSEEDVALLQVLADQVALAIENARLVTDTQAALAEMQATQRRYQAQAWMRESDRRAEVLGNYRQPGVPTSLVELPAATEEALSQRVTTEISLPAQDTAGSMLTVPLRLGEQILGVIEIHEIDPEHQWTEDDRALLEQVSEQVALAMETTRLFEETQRTAQRERLIGEITAKIRASTNIQDILKTTAVELGKALGTSRALVRLATEESQLAASSPEGQPADSAAND